MELVLSAEQEIFRDTTRKFLDAEMPVTKVRSLEASDRRLRARLVAPGSRAGLDVDARARRPRRGQPVGQRPARPGARGRGDGPDRGARPAGAGERRGRRPSPRPGMPSSRRRSCRDCWPATRSRRGRCTRAGVTWGAGGVGLAATRRGTDFVLNGTKSHRRGRQRRRSPPRVGTYRTGPHQPARPGGTPASASRR